MQHLLMNLEAPLISFGGQAVDNNGITRRVSCGIDAHGLLANALGWHRMTASDSSDCKLVSFRSLHTKGTAGGTDPARFSNRKLGKE